MKFEGLVIFGEELNGHTGVGVLPGSIVHLTIAEENCPTDCTRYGDFVNGVSVVLGFIVGVDDDHVGERELFIIIAIRERNKNDIGSCIFVLSPMQYFLVAVSYFHCPKVRPAELHGKFSSGHSISGRSGIESHAIQIGLGVVSTPALEI